MLIGVAPNIPRSAEPLSCSFKVPHDISVAALEKKRVEVAQTFIRHMSAQGYEFTGKGLRKVFGPHPDLPATMDASIKDEDITPANVGVITGLPMTGFVRYEIVGLFLVPNKLEVLE